MYYSSTLHVYVYLYMYKFKKAHLGSFLYMYMYMYIYIHCRKLQEYQAAYQSLKGLRTLEWKPHLGTVDLDLVLADRELSFSVSPIRATIIYQFQQQSEYSVVLYSLH